MSDKKEKNGTPPRIEVKKVNHKFTVEEFKALGQSLAEEYSHLTNIQLEGEQMKKALKAREAEAEARIGSLSTSIQNGWELREQRCRVAYDPKARKKRYYDEEDEEQKTVLLEEQMCDDDFQQELLQAESRFDHREEIELFPMTDADYGRMVVGQLGKYWYAAVRARVGQVKLDERLDSEQPITAKERWGAITKAASRYQKWILETLGKDNLAGFEEPLEQALAPHKERVE